MPQTIITGAQSRWKDSYAYSPEIGLAVRANGEETVKIIDPAGGVIEAKLTAPTVAPTIALGSSGGITGQNGKYVAYAYTYASTTQFPFVEGGIAFNGKIAPRSNPSPASTVFNMTDDDKKINVTVTKTTDTLIDEIWIFRTAFMGTSAEATLAAAAGQMFFVAAVTNPGTSGTITYNDNNNTVGGEIEFDNFEAPQFQFVVYHDPYFWGFGNFALVANATWTSGGVVTFSGSTTWFTGRNNQFITLEGITTGGFSNKGIFLFKYSTSTTGQLVNLAGTNVGTSAGSGKVVVQGYASTLYRSKYRNPFAWGETITNDDGTTTPLQFALKVGGGQGSALSVVPNQSLLKLDLENPTQCITYNLQTAGSTAFPTTKRLISDVYSISSHWSQYPTINAQGRTVLRGMDYKSYSILESDGISQQPVAAPLNLILRRLTNDRSRQLLAHGAYDPYLEINCMWVTTIDSLTNVNLLLFEHIPTGAWGMVEEHDVLCSGLLEDNEDSRRKIFVGTETGFIGRAFVEDRFNNWLPSTGLTSGSVLSATTTQITKADTENFNIVDGGLVGNWALVTDANGDQEQLARISAITTTTLTFDLFRSYTGGYTNQFSPTPAAGYKFYVGLIECRLRKYFDLESPSTDKKLEEIWATLRDSTNVFLRYFREQDDSPFASIQLKQTLNTPAQYPSSAFTAKSIPPTLLKSFGLELIERGYGPFQLSNLTLKVKSNP